MPTQVDSFPLSAKSPTGQSRYSQVLDGNTWECTPAEFAAPSARILQKRIRARAQDVGVKVRTSIKGEKLIVMAITRKVVRQPAK